MASEYPGLPCLVVIGPARLAGLVIPLSPPEVVIGHSDTADVVLEDEFVSRRHALVTVDESGVVTLSDLKSTSGTFVNDVLIDRPCVLRAGDLVRFADLVARFEAGMSSEAPVAALDAPTPTLPPSIGMEAMPPTDALASGLVRGTVRDAGGEPLSVVTVELVTWSVDPDTHVELAKATCDEMGCYELEWDRGERLERLEVRVLDAGRRQVGVAELSEGGEQWERVDIVATIASESEQSASGAQPADTDVRAVSSLTPTDLTPDCEYLVSGQVTWADGSPVVGVAVRAVDQDLRGEQPLGPHAPAFTTETRTDASGAYEIRYWRAQLARAEIATADLIVRVLDGTGVVVAASPTMFNAPARAVIDVSLSGAVAGQPSEYERLVALLTPLLADLTPPDVSSLLPADLEFLAGETDADRARLGELLTAAALYRDAVSSSQAAQAVAPPTGVVFAASSSDHATEQSGISIAVFYGMLREGMPADWAGLLWSGESAIEGALKDAAAAGIVPAELAQAASRIAAELARLAAKQIVAPTGTTSPSAVSELLSVATLTPPQQQTLVTAASNTAGPPRDFWAALPQHGFDEATIGRLQMTLQLSLLTGNHVPLIQRLLNTVSSVKQLLSIDAAAWRGLLAEPVAGTVIGVPPDVPGSTPQEQVDNFIKSVMSTLQLAFPNETIAGLVATNAISTPDARTRDAIGQFFTNSPDFDIRTTRITRYVDDPATTPFTGIPEEAHAAVVARLQSIQRAFQISVSADSMSSLIGLGLDAAHLVANIAPKTFVDRYATALGGPDVAQAIHQRATFVNARTIGLITQLNDTVNGVWPAALRAGLSHAAPAPADRLVAQHPDFAGLFGALDSCGCQECTSVLSPSAYFVRLFQFLAGSTPNSYLPPGASAPSGPSPTNSLGNTPLDVLIGKDGLPGRRPDLAYLKLTCENTNTELPYVDLVNEVMESFILYSSPSRYAANNTGNVSTAQLDASPQYTLDATQYDIATAPTPVVPPGTPPPAKPADGPYLTLANACYPFTLPFNEPLAVIRTYLQFLGTSRYDVMNAFRSDPAPVSAAIDAEYLRVDPYLYQLLTQQTFAGGPAAPLPTVAALYGSPKPYPGRTWEATVASVPIFRQHTGIATTDLIALLKTHFVNPDYPVGPDQQFLSDLPLDYTQLIALASANFVTTDKAILDALQSTGIALADVQAWWARNPNLHDALVIYSPHGGCDIADASISQFSGLAPPPTAAGSSSLPPPPPAPPTDTALDRLQTFIRLWRVVGWSMTDLDRALTTLGATDITPAVIHDLATISQLQATLGVPQLQTVFALWGNLDIGGADSLYEQLFLDPGALPNDPAFEPAAGTVLTDATQMLAGHTSALLAALQINAGDLELILADAFPASGSIPALTLTNVSVLYRYAALAQALSMSVADFITLKSICGLDPFKTPDATSAFVAQAQQVQGSSFTAAQLAYLYQDTSAPPTGLAPQATTLLVLAQTVRDGLTQIATQCKASPDPRGTLTATTVTQLVSKQVADATVAMLNGTASYSTPLTVADLPADLARVDAGGTVLGIDPKAAAIPQVGAKLSYDPDTGLLRYAGAMTDAEHAELLSAAGPLSAPAKAAFNAAVETLYAQPATFLADNLGPLLSNLPTAETVLLRAVASLDSNLNPLSVPAGAPPASTAPPSTAAAWKFGYLLGQLLPDLQRTLSHTLVKQTIADAFSQDPTLARLLLEQILKSPASSSTPVVDDLLALNAQGASVTHYLTPDLSGPGSTPTTVATIQFDGSTPSTTLPAGTGSMTATAWLELSSSATFSFSIRTNGAPQLYVGDTAAPTALTPDPGAGGSWTAANVALSAGGLTRIRLEITTLPATGATAVLAWQSQSIPRAPIPGSALLPDTVYETFASAYVRIQKAAMLCSQFVLTASEIDYVTRAGAATPALFAGFSLNQLPFTPGTTSSADATVLFAGWRRVYAYTALRDSLPRGSITLTDLFTCASFGEAVALLPQVTGWTSQVVLDLTKEFFPTLTPTSANPLVDEISLTAMQSCAALVQRSGASAAQLFSWAQANWPAAPTETVQQASFDGLHAIATDIQGCAQSHYDPRSWPPVAEQLNNTLRSSRRDALVSYLMGQHGYTDANDLFELLLIDPEMGACMQTSRIRQALNSVQLFVQRCLLGLETEATSPGLALNPPSPAAIAIEPRQIDASTWREWLGRYSTSAAAVETFLWPENFLIPSLRDDQTPAFESFVSSLQQGTITNESVQQSFVAYLKDLQQIDRLDIRSVFWQGPDPAVTGSKGVLHVFARTWHDPRVYFYRQLVGNPPGPQTWTPWKPVPVDIEGDILTPVIWEGKLRLIWPVFTPQSHTAQSPSTLDATPDGKGGHSVATGPAPIPYWRITLAWSELYQGNWEPKQVSADFLTSAWIADSVPSGWWATSGDNSTDGFTRPMTLAPGPQQPEKQAHVFKARLDGSDLIVDVYVQAPPDDNEVDFEHRTPLLLGEFRFSACGDTVAVGYSRIAGPGPPPGSPNLADFVYSATILPTPNAGPWNNGARQGNTASSTPLRLRSNSALGASGGDLSDQPWWFNELPPESTVRTYLTATPNPWFELRYSQQHWQFALTEPFFYQDAARTFYVTPGVGTTLSAQLSDTTRVDASAITRSLVASAQEVRVRAAGPATGPRDALVMAGEEVAVGASASVAGGAPPARLSPPGLVYYQGVHDSNWSAQYAVPRPASPSGLRFQTHRHPYVCSYIEALASSQGPEQTGGIDGLLNVANQNLSNGFDFKASYKPVPANVLAPAPTEIVDFSPTGAYSDVNWELFFHAPLHTAITLSQNGQYDDAERWFRHIFDPTTTDTSVPAPERYWQVQPFRTAVPETLLQLMDDIDNPSAPGHVDAVQQVCGWYEHPFEPFAIARSRIGAFQKAAFFAYLDHKLAWGDYLFGQVDSIESINQATQQYVTLSDLLGSLEQQIPSPHPASAPDYNDIRKRLDAFANFAETLENEFPFAAPVTSGAQSEAGGLLGVSQTLFFCIPQNPKLLGYWSAVADRLYKIRHCLNIHGVPQKLALFEPPADPLRLIEAAALGIDPGSVLADTSAPLPNFRFTYLIAKASELAATCQAFGSKLLEVLEKSDAEGLAALRATQETQILNLISDAKQQQINEAGANIDALNASRNVALTRYNFYQLLLGGNGAADPAVGASIPLATIPNQPPQSTGGVQLTDEEQTELDMSSAAAVLHAKSGLLQTLASTYSLLPGVSLSANAEPFGVGGSVSVSFGGSNLAAGVEATVHGLEASANYLTYTAWSAGKMGGYFRRQQEWAQQSNLAASDIMQIDKQLAAANIRLTIASDDLAVHDQQIVNAQKMQDYLTGKFTNQQLYDWMVGQVSTVYSQHYQLTYSTAKLAEVAHQRQLSVRDSSYITFGYWDSFRKGLLAGDRLQLAIKQLERAHIDQNEREFEITRHVSLLLHDPAAVIALKTTGQCVVDLPEELFDTDRPGDYMRRLRDVSLTIPCVAGPYTSINCTLTLLSSKIRVDPSTTSGSYKEKPLNADPRFIYHFGSTAAIATSHARDDSGVFSVDFRDERYLPFETLGLISKWLITIPPGCNAWELDTITDPLLTLRHTSRYGGDLLRAQAFAAATLPPPAAQTSAPSPPPGTAASPFSVGPPQTGRERLFSLRHEFPTEWYGLVHPPSATAPYGQMPIDLAGDRFSPAYRGRTIQITAVRAYGLSRSSAAVPNLAAYLTTTALPAPGTPPAPPPATTLPPSPNLQLQPRQTPGAGSPLPEVLTGSLALTTPISATKVAWWLSVPATDIPTWVESLEDLYLIFQYKVT